MNRSERDRAEQGLRNGQLKGVVKHHISPIFYYRDQTVSDQMILDNNESLDRRSEMLRWIRVDESELSQLLTFLDAL